MRKEKIKQLFLPLLLYIVFSALQFYFLRDKTQSWYFQDETDHVTLGWMMFKFGKSLYRDLSTNHQPLPILFGYFCNLFFSSSILFSFIEKIRLSMFLWHGLLGFYLVWRFKGRGLLTAVLYQSLGYYFFANYVLAESLAAPLIAILFNFLLQKALFKEKISNCDAIVIGLSIFGVAFNLLPLWPLLFLLTAYFLLHSQSQVQRQIFLASILIPSGLLFLWINPLLWFEETVYNLSQFYLPYLENPDPSRWRFLKLVFYPFLAFTKNNPPGHPLVYFFIVQNLILIFAALKFKEKRGAIFLTYILCVITNLRISQFPKTFYEGFHLLPLVVAFSSLTANLWIFLWQKSSPNWRWLYLTWLILIIASANSWALEKKDKLIEHHLNYSLFQTYGEAIKSIAAPGDTLLTGADGAGYMNQVSGLPFADRQNFHLSWAYRSPKLRAEFEKMIEKKAPTFIYFVPHSSDYFPALEKLMAKDYLELKKSDCGCGCTASLLFMRRDKLEQITPEQWQAFEQTVFTNESSD